jgi:CspA family cold shock protein
MKTRVTGVVSHFNYQRGFGFITPTDNITSDIFFHRKLAPGRKLLHEGTLVECEYVPAARGPEAVAILNIDETNSRIPASFRPPENAGPESDWIEARVKFYREDKGFGFVHGAALRRNAFLRFVTLCVCDMVHPMPQPDDRVRVKVCSTNDGKLTVTMIERLED